jgi:hypothetical protein
MNAITIWVGQELINFSFTAQEVFQGLSKYLGILKPIYIAFTVLLTKWLFLWFLYRKRVFLKA